MARVRGEVRRKREGGKVRWSVTLAEKDNKRKERAGNDVQAKKRKKEKLQSVFAYPLLLLLLLLLLFSFLSQTMVVTFVNVFSFSS